MIKTVIYYEDGERKEREFVVKGSRNSSGLHIDKATEIESIMFTKRVEYLGSFYSEER